MVTITSFTYTRITAKEFPRRYKNKEVSALDCVKPNLKIAVENLANHCLEACFNP